MFYATRPVIRKNPRPVIRKNPRPVIRKTPRPIIRKIVRNPPKFAKLLPDTLNAYIRNQIMQTLLKGVLGVNELEILGFATPKYVKVNCYAYFLTTDTDQWKERIHKSQPGDKCPHLTNSPLQFNDRKLASKQLIERVLCDNPKSVHMLKIPNSGYPADLLQIKLPKGYVLGCCIVGDSDYHFLRREGIDEILANDVFKDLWRKENKNNVKQQLEELRGEGHLYCWSHVAGWSSRLKLVDGSGNVIVNPAHKTPILPDDPSRNFIHNRANHTYNDRLTYDTFVMLCIIKVRSATLPNKNKLPTNLSRAIKSLEENGVSPETITRYREAQRMRMAR